MLTHAQNKRNLYFVFRSHLYLSFVGKQKKTIAKQQKTYNSGDSPVVTHLTTKPLVQRTRSSVVFWSLATFTVKISVSGIAYHGPD